MRSAPRTDTGLVVHLRRNLLALGAIAALIDAVRSDWDQVSVVVSAVVVLVALRLLPLLAERGGAMRTARALRRARAQAAVDPAFADERVLAAARASAQHLEGEHDADAVDEVGRMLGVAVAAWIERMFSVTGRSSFRLAAARFDIVRVLDRGGDASRRVVVRVEARLTIPRTLGRRRVAVAYWTYVERDGEWVLGAIEDASQGKRHLLHDSLTAPEPDLERLHGDAVLERAADEAVARPGGLLSIGSKVGGTATAARAAALDLALVDGRFAPDVIETCVRRLLLAWESATNGEPTALDGIATPRAIEQLLAAAPGSAKALREPRLKELRIVELDGRAEPPRVVVLGVVRAYPDMWNLDLCWRLALADSSEQPWRLVDADAWRPSYVFANR